MADVKYEAILVDTSIFDGNGLRLESGLLGKLKQFAESEVEFLMPDVIKNEIQSHLERKIHVARNALEKSINDAGDHLFFDGSILNDAKNLIVESEEIEGLAKSRFDNFLNNTSALEIQCDDYVSINNVLDFYFQNKAPFSESGKKKNEFPDAIVLLAIDKWANCEDKSVLAVAKDKDWKAFCEASDNIDYIEDFSEGLSKFNSATAPYALLENLKSALDAERAGRFIGRVENSLKSVLNGITPDQEADSHLYWEAQGARCWFKSFELYDNEFTIIDSGENWIVMEVWANITVEAEGEFSLSVYDSIDRDNVPMGRVTATVEQKFESQVLISLSGDLIGDINELNVDDVEVVDPISSVNFGTIEPDYSDYER